MDATADGSFTARAGRAVAASRALAAVALSLAALAAGSPAHAQGASARVVCESVDGRENFCPAPNDGRVEIARKLSRAPCTRDDTWRADRNGVYVRGGCRAEFAYRAPYGSGGWGGGGWGSAGGSRYLEVRCAADGGRNNFCPIENRDVRLLRAEGTCIEGQTWRFDARGIYVRPPCSAVFGVQLNAGDWGGGWGGWTTPPVYSLRCSSVKHRWAACPVEIGGRVVLTRQDSHAPCVRDWTWGTLGDEAIWVSEGCRGRFEVHGGRPYAGRAMATSGEGSAPPGVKRVEPRATGGPPSAGPPAAPPPARRGSGDGTQER